MTSTLDTSTALETVERITELQEQAERITTEIRALKAKLTALGVGSHQVGAIKVTVQAPARRFNLDRAATFLTEDQRALAVSLDPKKVKGFLPQVLLDECMDPGAGDPVVKLS